MSEEELRKEAVRRRQAGESAEEVAVALGRTSRWVRKWSARAEIETGNQAWAQGRSRAPRTSPDPHPRRSCARRSSTPGPVWSLNPRAQYGPLAVAWELRRMGVDPIPPRWTIERVIAAAGLARPRRRQAGYVSKGVPYPTLADPEPGAVHQIDMVGPRHLDGAIEFHALNLIDVGSHAAGSTILGAPRPTWVAAGIAADVGGARRPCRGPVRQPLQLPRGDPAGLVDFGPVVATCLDLDVVPAFIPLREPWRNGVVEHFNDVWDKSFFRTDPLRGPGAPAGRERRPSWPSTTSTTATRPTAGPAPTRSGPARTYQPLLPRLRGADQPAGQGAHRGGPLHPLQPPPRPVRQAPHPRRRAHPPIRHRHHQGPGQSRSPSSPSTARSSTTVRFALSRILR